MFNPSWVRVSVSDQEGAGEDSIAQRWKAGTINKTLEMKRIEEIRAENRIIRPSHILSSEVGGGRIGPHPFPGVVGSGVNRGHAKRRTRVQVGYAKAADVPRAVKMRNNRCWEGAVQRWLSVFFAQVSTKGGRELRTLPISRFFIPVWVARFVWVIVF